MIYFSSNFVSSPKNVSELNVTLMCNLWLFFFYFCCVDVNGFLVDDSLPTKLLILPNLFGGDVYGVLMLHRIVSNSFKSNIALNDMDAIDMY